MDIIKLIVKKRTSKLSETEQKALDSWIDSSPENREIFHRIMLIYRSDKDIRELESLDIDAIWQRILQKADVKEKVIKTAFWARPIFRYAAVFVGFLGLAAWYFFALDQSNAPVPVPDKNAITLQLENGEIKVLSEDGSLIIKDDEGNAKVAKEGTNLSYSDSVSVDKLVYNTLTVPYAKRFGITLSDGSKIHLNSGSSIKYPIKFIPGEQREVFLTGEAFFEVSEDKERPFIVTSEDLEVTVLGTAFNVKAYPEDREISTVLVSGSVGLSNKNQPRANPTVMQPGHMASWDKTSKTVSTKEVDTTIYTSWINGKLVLKRTSFERIVPKLQRHYDVSITNNYPTLNNKVFTASYDIETVGEVMESLSEIVPFHFTVNGREITISKPTQEQN